MTSWCALARLGGAGVAVERSPSAAWMPLAARGRRRLRFGFGAAAAAAADEKGADDGAAGPPPPSDDCGKCVRPGSRCCSVCTRRRSDADCARSSGNAVRGGSAAARRTGFERTLLRPAVVSPVAAAAAAVVEAKGTSDAPAECQPEDDEEVAAAAAVG